MHVLAEQGIASGFDGGSNDKAIPVGEAVSVAQIECEQVPLRRGNMQPAIGLQLFDEWTKLGILPTLFSPQNKTEFIDDLWSDQH